MSATAQLKMAFIKQAHEQDKMVTLALFVKELEDEIEVAQHIVSEYAHDFPQHVQLHMKNMLEAQLKLNAGASVIVTALLEHVAELANEDDNKAAQTAAMAAINKAMLH